jgi:hypothetical protein
MSVTPIEERYLGDGVYASYDGYHIWLDTRAQIPVNRIALEPGVVGEFLRYAAHVALRLVETETPIPIPQEKPND